MSRSLKSQIVAYAVSAGMLMLCSGSVFAATPKPIVFSQDDIDKAKAAILWHPFLSAQRASIDTLSVLLVPDHYLSSYRSRPIALVKAKVVCMTELPEEHSVGHGRGVILTLKLSKVLCSNIPAVEETGIFKTRYFASIPGFASIVTWIGPDGCHSSDDPGTSQQIIFPGASAYFTIKGDYGQKGGEWIDGMLTTAIKHFVVSSDEQDDIIDARWIEQLLLARVCQFQLSGDH